MNGYLLAIQKTDGTFIWVDNSIYRSLSKAQEALYREATHLEYDDGYTPVLTSILGDPVFQLQQDTYLLILTVRIL